MRRSPSRKQKNNFLTANNKWLEWKLHPLNAYRKNIRTMVWSGFPCGSAGKESACNSGDLGLIPGLGISPAERKDYPLQFSDLENSMDCIVHGVAKSQTWLSNLHFHVHELVIDFSFWSFQYNLFRSSSLYI